MIGLTTVLAALSVPALGVVLAALGASAAALPEPVPAAADKKRTGKSGPLKAVVACAGPSAGPLVFRYEGLADCRIVRSLYSGDRGCKDACLGYGTCRDVCPTRAIVLGPDGLPRVQQEYCDGCGRCAAECPSGSIRLVPKDADFVVGCSSRSAPDDRSRSCSVPCTACGICERLGFLEGFSVAGGLARIEYAKKAGNREKIARECPTGCIVPASAPERNKNAFQGSDNGLEWSERGAGAANATK